MRATIQHGGIKLLIADIDGTLLEPDKRLAPPTIEAVRGLSEAGIHFALASSRPPRGMSMLIGPLRVRTPLCGFNGGLIEDRAHRPIHTAPLAPAAARTAIRILDAMGLEVRVFDAQDWYVRDPEAFYARRERRTIGFAPRIVPDLIAVTGCAFKIVGAAADPELLRRCGRELRRSLGDGVNVAHSRPHYLDITDRRATKGHFVRSLSRLLGIARPEIAVIGDGDNDLPMFEEAGLAIAMGNAEPAVKAAAAFLTASNREHGFARAVERFVLGFGRARLAS